MANLRISASIFLLLALASPARGDSGPPAADGGQPRVMALEYGFQNLIC